MKTFLNDSVLVQLEERNNESYQVLVFFRNTHNTEIINLTSYKAALNKYNEVCMLFIPF